jgi:hypothetical protein
MAHSSALHRRNRSCDAAAAKKTVKAGQEVRLLDIPAKPQVTNDEKHYGVFENIHGFKSGGHFSKYLASAAANYYGTPLLEFLNHVMKEREKLKPEFQKRRDELEEKFLQPNASEQDSRAFQMFAFACFGDNWRQNTTSVAGIRETPTERPWPVSHPGWKRKVEPETMKKKP